MAITRYLTSEAATRILQQVNNPDLVIWEYMMNKARSFWRDLQFME
jgi:hypothetical protein